LEARKRALVTQSETCRETLKAEVQNLVLYGNNIHRRLDRVRGIGTWLLLGIPLAATLLGLFLRKENSAPRPSSGLKGRIATALLGLRLYRKYSPLVRTLVSQFVSRRRAAADRTPAANI